MLRKTIAWLCFIIIALSGYSQTAESSTDSTAIKGTKVEAQSLISETNELNDVIRRVESSLRESNVIEKSSKKYNSLLEQIEGLKESTEERLLLSNSIRTVREMLGKWNGLERKISSLQESLQAELSSMEEQRKLLEVEKVRWNGALENSLNEEGYSEELKQYQTTLKSNVERISNTLLELKDSTSKALAISSDIIQMISDISDIKEEMTSNQSQQFAHLFTQVDPAIWNSTPNASDSTSVVQKIKLSWTYTRQDLTSFFIQNKWPALLHLAIYLCLLALFYYTQFNYSNWEVFRNENLKPTILFLSKPFAASAFVAIFLSYTIYSNMPVTVSELNALLAMVPLLFILPQLVKKEYHKVIYVLAVIFALDQLNFVFGLVENVKRILLLGQGSIALVGSALFFKIQQSENKQRHRLTFFQALAIPGIIVVALGYAIGVVSNTLGYTNLCVYLVRSITFSLIALFLFFILLQMLKGLFTLVLYGRLSQTSNIIQRHQDHLFRAIHSISIFILFILWIKVFLLEFGFKEYLEAFVSDLVSRKWIFGQVTITLQNIVDSIVVMVVAWYVGVAFRYLLEDEILPRITSKRGLPAAVGISVRYLFISGGFILAVASLGLDLNKLGFIAGALSVGIGFGLQNVVGNFISGLILLFERPVVPGDIVRVDQIEGSVLEIGLRSSKVKTWDGAEVIIPNMDLISKSVTNLTLSDKKRRMEKIIETEKDADPKTILDSIKAVLITHPEILADPSVQVLFKGQFANCYRFRILYWLTGNVLNVDSDVNILLDKTLEEMGVRIAIPEKKVSISGGKVN